MKQYDLIIFDWDGTLMDSTDTIARSVQASARDLNMPIPTLEKASYVIGLGLVDAFKTVMPDLDPNDYPKLLERYRYHFFNQDSHLSLFDGVMPMLLDLLQKDYVLAVATGKSRAGLNRALKSTELDRVFAATRCADETFSKPHPAMVLEIMETLGHSPTRTLMVGDTTHDLYMAQQAKIDAVAVTYGAHPLVELEKLQPAYIASDVFQLHKWILAQ